MTLILKIFYLIEVSVKVGYLKQNKFGGTDFVIDKAVFWLSNNGVECIELDSGNSYVAIEVDIVLLPTSEIYAYSKLRVKGFKCKRLLVWSMGYGALDGAFFNPHHSLKYSKLIYPIKSIIKKIKIELLESQSLVFTDTPGMYSDLDDISRNYGCKVIPIPIQRFNSDIVKSIDYKKLTCGWVGRVSNDFKVQPLIDLIRELNFYFVGDVKLECFYIIGNGDGFDLLNQELDLIKPYFNIKYIEHIDLKKLPFFLNKKIDFLFAMGTSSLDGARASVPTVIVKPYSLKDKEGGVVDSNKYRFIYTSVGFSLGEFYSDNILVRQPDLKLYDIERIIKYVEYDELVSKSKSYSDDFIDDVVFPKLHDSLKNVGDSSLSFFNCCLIVFFYKFKKMIKDILNVCK